MGKLELNKYIESEINLLHERIKKYTSNSKIIQQLKEERDITISVLIDLKRIEVENCEIERDNTISKYEIRILLKQIENESKQRAQDVFFIKERINNKSTNYETSLVNLHKQIEELSTELGKLDESVSIVGKYISELRKVGML